MYTAMTGSQFPMAFFPGTFFVFGLPVFMLALLLWTFVWKGWALWLAARRGEKLWFLLLLVVNTAGLLEIAYIFLIAKKSDKPIKAHE